MTVLLKYIHVLFFIPLILSGCNSFKHSTESYSEFDKNLKTEEDSILQFIEYCDTKHFDKAITLYPFTDSFSFTYPDVIFPNGEQISYSHFPFPEYSSTKLLLLGIYIDRRYESEAHVRVLDQFLRHSILVNNQNDIAILELARLGILGNDVLNTYCLLQFVSESPKYKSLANKMLEYCKDNPFGKITVLPHCNQNLVWICENIGFGFAYINYDGYNQFSKFKRKEE